MPVFVTEDNAENVLKDFSGFLVPRAYDYPFATPELNKIASPAFNVIYGGYFVSYG